MTMPKWSNPNRQAHLAKILSAYLLHLEGWELDLFSGEFCNPQYDDKTKAIIAYWKQGDNIDKRLAWKAEVKALHNLAERSYPLRGRFNNIAQDIWHDKQPVFYLECLGMSALTMTPFARVKISSSYMRLYVDLGNTLRQGVSKNARRKAIRYGKALPIDTERKVNEIVREAVRHYLK